jgi:hypothetical protein
VARAKRTERAEARRRYRAANAPEATTDGADGNVGSGGQSRSGSGSSASANPTVPPGRVGFSAAFKLAMRPLNARADIAALPWIAIHTKALWLPVLITVASTVYVIATGGNDVISQFMFAYFIAFPAIGGPFIAGFLAPRASWLLGGIVGTVSAACYSVLILFYPTAIYASARPTDEQARDAIISAFVLSPVMGGIFAASAAWYRRFLAYSSPNRNRSRAQSQKQARPGDGRTRGGTTTSQKSSAKR